MNIVKIISTTTDSSFRRIIKLLRYGRNDVQTSYECQAYGLDSNPIKDMIAIYSDTGIKGQTAIIGYINKNQKSEPGEMRIYSTDDNGGEKIDIWLKKDGTAEFGGNLDNLVRYSQLNLGLQQQVLAINVELAKIATAIGGAYVVMPISLDVSESKINELKTS